MKKKLGGIFPAVQRSQAYAREPPDTANKARSMKIGYITSDRKLLGNFLLV